MKQNEVLEALAALSQVNRLRAFRTPFAAGPVGSAPSAIAKQSRVRA